MHLLFIVSIICCIWQIVKEALTPEIPAENWANKELYHKDMMSGMSTKELMKNVERGKYKITEQYPEPHRNERGQIMIENTLLYKQDCKEYGVAQAHKWMRQGKYNLTSEELEKEEKRIREQMKHLYR